MENLDPHLDLKRPEEQKSKSTLKSKGYLVYLLIILFFCQILDSYTSDGINQRLSAMVVDFFPLLTMEEGLLEYQKYAAILSLGMVGSIFFQRLADRFGRKWLLILTTIFMWLLPLVQIFIYDFRWYAVTAFLLFMVTQSDIWMIFINEEAPKGKNAIWSAVIVIGGIFAGILIVIMRGLFFTDDPRTSNWRGMLYLSVGLGVVLTFIILFTLKETTAFEIKKIEGDTNQHKGVLNLQNSIKMIFARERIKPYITILFTNVVWVWTIPLYRFADIYVGSGFSKMTPTEYTLAYSFAVIGLAIGFLGTGILADIIGRKVLMITYAVLIPIITLITLTVTMELEISTQRILFTGIMMALNAWASFGLWILNQITTIELMPTRVRGTAAGLKTTFTGISLAIYQWVFGVVQLKYGLGSTMIVSSFLIYIALPLLFFFMVETKGRDLKKSS